MLFVLGWFTPLGDPQPFPLTPRPGRFALDLLPILAGISAALFALTIFVAQSLRDARKTDVGRILLRESLLFPLATGTIGVFLLFAVVHTTSLVAGVAVLLLAVLFMRAFYRSIRVLLNPSLLRERRLALLDERCRGAARAQAIARMMQNGFVALTKQLAHVEYNPFSHPDTEKATSFFSSRSGRIVDVRPDRLQALDSWVAVRLQSDDSARPAGEVEPVTRSIARGQTRGDSKALRLTILPGDTVEVGKRVVMQTTRNVQLDGAAKKQAEALLGSLFKCGNGGHEETELQEELERLLELAAESLRGGEREGLRFAADGYRTAAESFLSVLKECGGLHETAEQAKAELSGFGSGWTPVELIVDDVTALIELTAERGDRRSAFEIVAIPYALAEAALEAKDLYLFLRVLQLEQHLGWAALKWNTAASEIFYHRSWHQLQEIGQYSILFRYKAAKDEATAAFYEAAYDRVLTTYQRLIKAVLGTKDLERLTNLLDNFQHFAPEYFELDIDHSTSRDLGAEPDSLTKRKRDMGRRIRMAQEEVLLGLTAYQLALWKAQPIPDPGMPDPDGDVLKELLARLPQDAPHLTEVFLKAREASWNNRWGWTEWEGEGRVEGVVYSPDFSSKLDEAYIVGLLRTLRDGVRLESVGDCTLSFAQEVEGENAALVRLLNVIERNPERLATVLSPDQLTRTGEVLAALQTTAEHFREKERRDIAARPLDESRIITFGKELIAERDRTGTIRGIFRAIGNTERREAVFQDPVRALGIDTMFPKEAFFEGWHVHYMDFGANFGRAFSGGEDRDCFNAWFAAGAKRVAPDISGFEGVLKTVLAQGIANGWKTPAVIGGHDLLIETGIWRRVRMEGAGRQAGKYANVPGFEGMLEVEGQEVPVFRAGREDLKAVACDLSRQGPFTEIALLPSSRWEGARQVDGMLVKIRDLNVDEEERDRLLADPPQWLQKIEESERESSLRRQVTIDIRGSSELRIDGGSTVSLSVGVPNSTEEAEDEE